MFVSHSGGVRTSTWRRKRSRADGRLARPGPDVLTCMFCSILETRARAPLYHSARSLTRRERTMTRSRPVILVVIVVRSYERRSNRYATSSSRLGRHVAKKDGRRGAATGRRDVAPRASERARMRRVVARSSRAWRTRRDKGRGDVAMVRSDGGKARGSRQTMPYTTSS